MADKPDYVVRVSGWMPDGTHVDKKFTEAEVEDALTLASKMPISDMQYLKPIRLSKLKP